MNEQENSKEGFIGINYSHPVVENISKVSNYVDEMMKYEQWLEADNLPLKSQINELCRNRRMVGQIQTPYFEDYEVVWCPALSDKPYFFRQLLCMDYGFIEHRDYSSSGEIHFSSLGGISKDGKYQLFRVNGENYKLIREKFSVTCKLPVLT